MRTVVEVGANFGNDTYHLAGDNSGKEADVNFKKS